MILISGQGLQRRYSNGTGQSGKLTDSDKKVQQSDRAALRKASRARRAGREEREELRMKRNISPKEELEILKKNPEKDIDVEDIVKKAKSQTNVIAREHGLPQPNNEEALVHDRLHCMTCDRKLDSPNAGKTKDDLFDDVDVRLMCCWCFGKMSDSDIKDTMYTGKEASAEIRLKVYNPEQSTKAEIESLVESKMIQMKSKLKRWEQNTALVGNIKHDYLQEGDDFENIVRNNANTRWTSCTL